MDASVQAYVQPVSTQRSNLVIEQYDSPVWVNHAEKVLVCVSLLPVFICSLTIKSADSAVSVSVPQEGVLMNNVYCLLQ